MFLERNQVPEGVTYIEPSTSPGEEGQSQQYRAFIGRANKYAVYPSYWAKSWGQAPLLGVVTADNEFLAERAAYDRGILNPANCTFRGKFKLLQPSK
jgi:hypothetical protein